VDIAVLVKVTYEPSTVKADAATKAPVFTSAQFKISEFDKHALEAATQLKPKLGNGTVRAIVAAKPKGKEVLKEVLARGADEAVFIPVEDDIQDPAQVAALLAAAVKEAGGGVVLASEASVDAYSSTVGPLVAARLGWPVVCFATAIEVAGGGFKVEREGDGGTEVFEVASPCVITVNEAMNKPKTPTLIQIVGAGKKKVTERGAADLGAPVATTKVEGVSAVVRERKRVLIAGAPEEAAAKLVEELSKEGVL
jgi:electron transfer flavoprotein beta subunit